MRRYYIGFSTVGESKSRQWTHYDSDLVRRDLTNHFHTRIGERAMRSDWGCAIWDWLFEPFSEDLRSRVSTEAIRICESDPRVSVSEVIVEDEPHAITVSISLVYRGIEAFDTFTIEFERRETIRTNKTID